MLLSTAEPVTASIREEKENVNKKIVAIPEMLEMRI